MYNTYVCTHTYLYEQLFSAMSDAKKVKIQKPVVFMLLLYTSLLTKYVHL